MLKLKARSIMRIRELTLISLHYTLHYILHYTLQSLHIIKNQDNRAGISRIAYACVVVLQVDNGLK